MSHPSRHTLWSQHTHHNISCCMCVVHSKVMSLDVMSASCTVLTPCTCRVTCVSHEAWCLTSSCLHVPSEVSTYLYPDSCEFHHNTCLQCDMDTQPYPEFDKFKRDPNRSKLFYTSGFSDVFPVLGVPATVTAPLVICRGRPVQESGSGYMDREDMVIWKSCTRTPRRTSTLSDRPPGCPTPSQQTSL